MQFMLLFSRQGKLRLQKWYVPLSDKERKKISRDLVQTILARKPKMCSFLEWRDLKIVYKRYASLYFCCAVEDQDNELITLEIIHRYVELLDKYFGSVCELDIIFNFEKAYFILDEFLLGGEAQETSRCQRSRGSAKRPGGDWTDIDPGLAFASITNPPTPPPPFPSVSVVYICRLFSYFAKMLCQQFFCVCVYYPYTPLQHPR
ncbi:AP-1 complex subunit sigma-2 isoform X1 [Hypomesus transpacificus]|uniref:AP-1 complex subunit sigma-2 isoform X1 n=1 Tax=Hypomesus transpacificus TaxID=137520 RepID=UPI001F07B5B7|nr:AP-1 complex subunit sigma-2 isoform X1 [Hypomesus transpacificus]